jgi:hypothetical protein
MLQVQLAAHDDAHRSRAFDLDLDHATSPAS